MPYFYYILGSDPQNWHANIPFWDIPHTGETKMQTWIIYIVAPVLVVGVYLYLKFFRDAGLKKSVLLLRPNGFRYTTLPVQRETDEGLYCRRVGGISYRFFKTGPGWTEKEVKFLGVEGTPLISWIKEGTSIKTSIPEFLKFVWSEKVYNKLTEALKKPLEEGIGVIVTVDPIIPDKKFGLDQVMSDAILAESDRANLEEFGKGTPKKETMKELVMNIFQILLGAFGMYFLIKQQYL